jgi:hypothetical protein
MPDGLEWGEPQESGEGQDYPPRLWFRSLWGEWWCKVEGGKLYLGYSDA